MTAVEPDGGAHVILRGGHIFIRGNSCGDFSGSMANAAADDLDHGAIVGFDPVSRIEFRNAIGSHGLSVSPHIKDAPADQRANDRSADDRDDPAFAGGAAAQLMRGRKLDHEVASMLQMEAHTETLSTLALSGMVRGEAFSASRAKPAAF